MNVVAAVEAVGKGAVEGCSLGTPASPATAMAAAARWMEGPLGWQEYRNTTTQQHSNTATQQQKHHHNDNDNDKSNKKATIAAATTTATATTTSAT